MKRKEEQLMGKAEFEERIDHFRILDDTFMNEVFKGQDELV